MKKSELKKIIREEIEVNAADNFFLHGVGDHIKNIKFVVKGFMQSVKILNEKSISLETGTEYFASNLTRIKRILNRDDYDKLVADYKEIRKLSVQIDRLIEKFWGNCSEFTRIKVKK